METPPCSQRGLDILTLLLVQKPLDPHEYQHVVPDVGRGEQCLGETSRSSCDLDLRVPSIAGGADVHGLSRIECAMGQRAALPRGCLLYEHWATAERAPARLFDDVKRHRSRGAEQQATAGQYTLA